MAANGGAATTRCRSTRRSPTSSRSCRRSRTCTTSACVYCDFKPDNVIQVGDAVKLIDLGGVRRARRRRSPRSTARSATRRPRSPQVGPTVASDIYTIGRTLVVLGDGVPRLPDDVRRPRCPPVERHAAVPAARLALPAAAQGVRARPGRPVPVRRRAARPAARRAARGRGRRQRRRHGAALGRRRCCSRRPAVDRATRSTGTQLPGAARRHRPTPSTRGCSSAQRPATRPASAWPRSRRPPSRPPRCAWPRSRRRSRPASPTWSTQRSTAAARRRPVGVAGGLDARASPPCQRGDADGRRGGVQRGLRPGAGRAGAQAGAGARLRARRPTPTSPRALRHLRADRRQLHRPRGVRAGPDPRPRAATSTAPSRRSTWCRRPAARTASPAQLRAEVLLARSGRRPDPAQRRHDQRRRSGHRAATTGPSCPRKILGHALEVVTRKGPGTVRIGQLRGQGASAAGRARGELPGAWPGMRRTGTPRC